MVENQVFSDKLYGERESLVKKYIGTQLDELQEQLKQLYSPCMTRLMNAQIQVKSDKDMTIGDLLNLEASKRQMVVTATIYNDALWRLEAAFLMLRIGMLNVAYSNLRSCLESLITAHIIENIESEAVRFLNGKKINQDKIAPFITNKYNEEIQQIKNKLGEWGVHSGIESIRLGILFNPSTFDKMIAETKISKPQTIHQEFGDYAETCIQAINTVFLIFVFLIHKGTRYRRDITTDG